MYYEEGNIYMQPTTIYIEPYLCGKSYSQGIDQLIFSQIIICSKNTMNGHCQFFIYISALQLKLMYIYHLSGEFNMKRRRGWFTPCQKLIITDRYGMKIEKECTVILATASTMSYI